MSEALCPACGHPLARYGCVDVEQVGAFCRGPVPERPRLETREVEGTRESRR